MARRDITPLGITTLALLEELGKSYPYEMYQVLLKRSADQVVKLSAGTLYHTIDRLAERGLVRPTRTERHGNRPERTAYEITPEGITALRNRVTELLAHPPAEYPVFPVVVGEIHHLRPEDAVNLLERRVEQLQAAREPLLARLDGAHRRGVARRFLLGADYMLSQLDANLAWTHNLIHDITSGALDWDMLNAPTAAVAQNAAVAPSRDTAGRDTAGQNPSALSEDNQ